MSEYADYLHEIFADFGTISVRRMFGGYGVYHDGLMFGLVANDVLYLKTDAANIVEFERLGLGPFEYSAKGRTNRIAYHQAPEEIMDDPEAAAHWARIAFAAALRARAAKPPGKRRERKPAAKA